MHFPNLLSYSLRSTTQIACKPLPFTGWQFRKAMTAPARTLSSAVFERMQSPSSKLLSNQTKLPNFAHHLTVRHAHDDSRMFDLEKLGIPKRLIGWQHRLLLRWKLGNQFDAKSFFDGVKGAFLYVTESIKNKDEEALPDILIGEARQKATQYMSEAEKEDDAYTVEENDIVVLKVTAVDFESADDFCGLSDVTVLSMYVWIAYMKDCIKVLEGSNPGSKDSWSDVAKKLGEMQKHMQELSRHAEFKFQRAYDNNLEAPLTDWVISQLVYKIPKSTDEEK